MVAPAPAAAAAHQEREIPQHARMPVYMCPEKKPDGTVCGSIREKKEAGLGMQWVCTNSSCKGAAIKPALSLLGNMPKVRPSAFTPEPLLITHKPSGARRKMAQRYAMDVANDIAAHTLCRDASRPAGSLKRPFKG